jgi:hypothetical protein
MSKEGVLKVNLLWKLGREESVIKNLGTKIL